jgi:hypothetical protein
MEENLLEMEIGREISMRELYELLGERFPAFEENLLVPYRGNNRIAPLLAMVEGRSCSMDQKIHHGDAVELYLIAAGG